jgi:hypothetical protein
LKSMFSLCVKETTNLTESEIYSREYWDWNSDEKTDFILSDLMSEIVKIAIDI